MVFCYVRVGARRNWSAYGQSSTATLSGTVTDEAGAVIAAVNLTLLNLSTALQRHATTDEAGAYIVPLLPPGRYKGSGRGHWVITRSGDLESASLIWRCGGNSTLMNG